MKKILKVVVHLIHKLFLFFIIFGVFLPEKYLFYYIITFPIVYIHWKLNNNYCILTQLEYMIDNKPYPPTIDKNHPFIKSIFDELNIKISSSELHNTILYGYNILWLIGIIRYFRLYKKFI